MPEHAATLETAANIARKTVSCLMPAAIYRPISMAFNELEATKKKASSRHRRREESALHAHSRDWDAHHTSSVRRENGADLTIWPICALHYSD
jgi:hypothetical protein